MATNVKCINMTEYRISEFCKSWCSLIKSSRFISQHKDKDTSHNLVLMLPKALEVRGRTIFFKRRRLISHANAKSKSEKFPPPHQDGALGFPLGSTQFMDPNYDPPDVPYSSTTLTYQKGPEQNWSGPLVDDSASVGAPRRKKQSGSGARTASRQQAKETQKGKGGIRVREKECVPSTS